jgi:hypothetical protein
VTWILSSVMPEMNPHSEGTGMGGAGGLDLLVNHSPNMDRVATCCPRFEGRSARA